MAMLIDEFFEVQVKVGQRYFIAKPVKKPLISRLKDICGVITGRYEAVKFAEFEHAKVKDWKKVTSLVSPLVLEKAKEQVAIKMLRAEFKGQMDQDGNFKAGKNDPCPCRRGKKFKHCHGRSKK